MSTTDPVFVIEKIYVKDLSLEIPHAPEIYLEEQPPQIEVELNNEGSLLDEGLYETVLTVTVTASFEDKTYFLIEVKQAGIFQIRNVTEDSLQPTLGIVCPNILFPYAREVVSDMVTRAGFPPVLLSPINFEALYYQQQAENQEGTSNGDETTKH
jgi:preprotein translocase subunit SecB